MNRLRHLVPFMHWKSEAGRKVALRWLESQISARSMSVKRFTTTSVVCVAFAALSVCGQVHAEASAAREVIGPYIGTTFGAAFGNREIDDSNSNSDERVGRSAKIFAGYQLTENFGVQAGYVHMHDLNQNTGSGPTRVNRTVDGNAAYLAGTARLPLGRSFALTGKAGVSRGKVTGVSPSGATNNSLIGRNTAVIVGAGTEYALNRGVWLSVELESYGRISGQVKGSTLTVGFRFMF